MNIEILIFLLIFATVLLLGLGFYFYIQYRRESRDLIRRVVLPGETNPENPDVKARPATFLEEKIMMVLQKLGGILRPERSEQISELRRFFLKAGYRKENSAIIYFGLKAFLAILFVLAAFTGKLFIWKTINPVQFISLTLFSALSGLYLPNLWMKIRISQRKEKIQHGLPDSLDLMVVCVEAGTGLDAAINRVGEEMKLKNPVLSDEFKLVSLELRAGKNRKDALRNLAMRTDLEDITNLVTLLIQTERFGTSIAQALRVHSDFMRTKRQQRAEEIAAKLPTKLILPLVLFIFPSFLLVALGPALISIFRFFIVR